MEWLVASVGEHLVPSLRWAEWLFWEWDLLDTTLSDVWETPILSVFVQGDKCVLYFHTTNTTKNGLLKLKLDISLVPPPLLHPSFIHPTSPLCFWSSHLVLLSWGDIHSCWNGGKGTLGRNENISQQLSSQACKLILFLLPFTIFSVWFLWQWLSRIYIYSDMLKIENLCSNGKGLWCTV